MTAPTTEVQELTELIAKAQIELDVARHFTKCNRPVQAVRYIHNIQRLLNDTWPPEPDAIGHDWTAEIPF